MSIRLFKLPADLDNLYTLITAAFQYPENPEWNADADEANGLKTAIQTFKRIWPLFRQINWMSPAMRDALLGYIWEEDGKPVGLVTVSRRGTTDSWMIGNVTVLPEYSRWDLPNKVDTELRQVVIVAPLELIWGKIPQGRVATGAVVEALVVLPERRLPALSLFPGATPAQEAR
jgi:hypothetical protein